MTTLREATGALARGMAEQADNAHARRFADGRHDDLEPRFRT